jgi:glycosyltransferase involved in cell wall biosynthesis
MRLGVAIEETWDFFHEVYADLAAHHDTTLFKRRPHQRHLPRLNGRLAGYWFRKDLGNFLRANDVVFFEWASGLLAAASHMPKACGIVTRLHRYEMYQWAQRINWDAVDRLIVVSEAKLREFSEAFPQQAYKAVVIPEAVSVDRFRPATKRFNGDIGILGHMKPRKRVYELVLTFHELTEHSPDFHLHIGGGRAPGFEEYHEVVTQLVDRLGLRDKVTFYGHIQKPEEWYPLIDILVSNGYSEGLQVSPMEAMATGCYCLSHHWDGAEELLPAGQLFYGNTRLKDLVLAYAAMPDLEKEAARSRMRALVCERFNVDVTKVRIRQVIEAAAQSRRAA